MRRAFLIGTALAFGLLFIQPIHAEVKLPAIVSSNMVLQRNTTVQLWGWADAGEKITIKLSWLQEPLKLSADNEGNWAINVKTTNTKASQTINIKSDSSDITLENIVFGEVWLCSGQSNMSQSFKGYTGQPTFGASLAVAKSRNPNLRLFTVERATSKTPLKNVGEHRPWQMASPENVLDFSAIAYFFGQQLQEILDVPVGLIHTSWGGTPIESWMSMDMMSTYKKIDLDTFNDRKKQSVPTVLYNAMINPLIPYTIKGALWYQGESNRGKPDEYRAFMPALVKDWRDKWRIGDFPFYYVQIAPYFYNNPDAFQKPENSAFLREAQLQALEDIPNSGMATTMDIGEEFCIHPAIKKEVADRLLFNALNQTYGYTTIDCAFPVFDSLEIKDGGAILKFKNAETGLYSYNGLEGFEIAGEDRVFYPAKAEIVKRQDVFVHSEKVEKPVAVRYAWHNWIKGTLFDANLLPASSFRTDNWDNATQAKD